MGILAKLKSQSKVIEYLMGSSIRQITGWLQKEKVKYEYRYYKPTLTPFPKNQNTPQKPREIANLILLNADGDYKQALLSEGYEFNNIKLKEILQTKNLAFCQLPMNLALKTQSVKLSSIEICL